MTRQSGAKRKMVQIFAITENARRIGRNSTQIFIPNLYLFSDAVLNKTKVLLSKNLKIKIYKTIMKPVVLFGCEAWSLTLREESRPRVFEKGS